MICDDIQLIARLRHTSGILLFRLIEILNAEISILAKRGAEAHSHNREKEAPASLTMTRQIWFCKFSCTRIGIWYKESEAIWICTIEGRKSTTVIESTTYPMHLNYAPSWNSDFKLMSCMPGATWVTPHTEICILAAMPLPWQVDSKWATETKVHFTDDYLVPAVPALHLTCYKMNVDVWGRA